MIVTMLDGRRFENRHPYHFCTGYKAASIEMQRGDFESLRKLAYEDPVNFNAVMLQLNNRFQTKKSGE